MDAFCPPQKNLSQDQHRNTIYRAKAPHFNGDIDLSQDYTAVKRQAHAKIYENVWEKVCQNNRILTENVYRLLTFRGSFKIYPVIVTLRLASGKKNIAMSIIVHSNGKIMAFRLIDVRVTLPSNANDHGVCW